MLEKDIESRVCRYAKKLGVTAEKFTSPSKRSVPDDLFTFKGGRTAFIEFKAPGKKATPKQALDHHRRRAQGSLVYVIDDIELGKALVDTLIAILSDPVPVGSSQVPGSRG